MPPSLTGPFQVLCGLRFDKPASTAQHRLIARLSSVAQSPATTSGAFKLSGTILQRAVLCRCRCAATVPVGPVRQRSAQKRKQPVERYVDPAGTALELIAQLVQGLLDLKYAQQPLSRCSISGADRRAAETALVALDERVGCKPVPFHERVVE